MWNRACPLCFARVPRRLMLRLGDDLVCPSCHAALELSKTSRTAGAFGGLFCGFVAARMLGSAGEAGWVLPVLGAALAYGLGCAAILCFLSDLVVQSKPPPSHFPQSQK
jgi:hypothetical protein